MDWCFTISHDQPYLSWKEHYHLKEQIERWILKTISGAGVALALPKLTHKKRTFQTQLKIAGSYKKCV